MTLVQMQPRSTHANPVHRTVDDAMEAAGPQVCDDMTVEVALAVMASARAVICSSATRTACAPGWSRRPSSPLSTTARRTPTGSVSATCWGTAGRLPHPQPRWPKPSTRCAIAGSMPCRSSMSRAVLWRPRPCPLNRLTTARPSPFLLPVRQHALCHRPFPVRPDQERCPGVDEGRQARAGRRRVRDHRAPYLPVKQVGQVITRQDRRDFSAGEVLRAMTQLGFTCRGLPRPPRPGASSARSSRLPRCSASR